MFFHGDVNLLARVTDKPTKATNIAPPPTNNYDFTVYINQICTHQIYNHESIMTFEHDQNIHP